MSEPSLRPDAEGPELAPCPSSIHCPLGVHYHCSIRPEDDSSSSKPASRKTRVGFIGRAYLWLTMYTFYGYGLVVGVPASIGLGIARWFRSFRHPRNERKEDCMVLVDGPDSVVVRARNWRPDPAEDFQKGPSLGKALSWIPWYVWLIVVAAMIVGIAVVVTATSIG